MSAPVVKGMSYARHVARNAATRVNHTNLPNPNSSVTIRELFATRRVLLQSPTLTATEMSSLGTNLQLLSRNNNVNSILVAHNHDTSANGNYPAFLSSTTDVLPEQRGQFFMNQQNPYKIDPCFLGYDPLSLVHPSNSGNDISVNPDEVHTVLSSLLSLSSQMNTLPKSPAITMPHGLIADGGYSLCLGRYVLATPNTRFAILNPEKGLSFDPCGLSYILPRLGHDYSQPSAHYPCGKILALTGYVANPVDMVSTGLATHLLPWEALPHLERSLSVCPTFGDSRNLNDWKRKHYAPADLDNDYQVMNSKADAGIQNTIYGFSEMDARARDFLADSIVVERDDDGTEKLLSDPIPGLPHDYDFETNETSNLVLYGEMFQKVFEEESLRGILEGLRSEARKLPLDTPSAEDRRRITVANGLLRGMESQSPLALLATHRLFREGERPLKTKSSNSKGAGGSKGSGSVPKVTLETRMEREKGVQMELFQRTDFKRYVQWKRDTDKGGTQTKPQWKHRTIRDVSKDELDSLFLTS